MVTGVDLTSLSHGAGCGCKLPASALLPIVRGEAGEDLYGCFLKDYEPAPW